MTTMLYDVTSSFFLRLTSAIKFCVSTIGDAAVDVVNSDMAD